LVLGGPIDDPLGLGLLNARRSSECFIWLVALTALGCAPSLDLLGKVSSSGPAGDAGLDAGAWAPRFSPPTLVPAISDPTADDEDPTFTGDLRELYFSSDRAGNSDIWVSRRASPADPWGTPTMVVELSSSAIDRSPSVSLDGRSIWFTTDRELFRGRIWHSSRPSTQSAWAPPAPVSELASPNFDSAPSIDAAETTMFFSSVHQNSSTGTDIYASTRASVAQPWGTPVRVPGLDTTADEADPFVAQGGLVVFFTLTRNGQSDLYSSVRRSTDAPFPLPWPLTDVNSPAIDSDPTLSVDLLYLMFASSRSGNTEIYESHAIQAPP
jgi:hypothetical protein